jgi:hypothetical protein
MAARHPLAVPVALTAAMAYVEHLRAGAGFRTRPQEPPLSE